MRSQVPEVSVVIVSARPIRLAFALDALAAQTVGIDRFEVIVVRDPSSPAPFDPGRAGMPATFIEGPERANIAALRNVGWRAAEAPIVAFTDDDCRPSPGWLEEALAATGPDVVVQGRTEPDPDELHLLHGLARTQFIRELSPWMQTCNILYPRSMLAALDGFDEDFAQIGEDAELGCRALDAGAEVRFAADALVWHAVIPRTLGRALREGAQRDTLPLLVRRHPRLRGALRYGVFLKPSHALFTLGVAGSLVARKPALRAAAWAPYVASHLELETVTGPRRAAHALLTASARAAVDAVEVATAARGSVAERVLVL